jgi:hypothetical protein
MKKFQITNHKFQTNGQTAKGNAGAARAIVCLEFGVCCFLGICDLEFGIWS